MQTGFSISATQAQWLITCNPTISYSLKKILTVYLKCVYTKLQNLSTEVATETCSTKVGILQSSCFTQQAHNAYTALVLGHIYVTSYMNDYTTLL